MPDQKKELLFETFTQADESDTRKYGGIGLGLAICKQLAMLLNCQIDVSGNTGGGSIFSFTVLLKQTKPSEMAGSANTNIITPTDLNVLVVDDNSLNRKVIEGLCKKLGWKTQWASDGSQAVDILTKTEYDLILMDCQMPVMDGYQATQMIRDPYSSVLKHDVPIIAVTANISDENRKRCLDAGMNDFISKPVNLQKIKTVLNTVIEQRNHHNIGKH
ncbi:MAG: response regulator [Pseudomonadota bacterium]